MKCHICGEEKIKPQDDEIGFVQCPNDSCRGSSRMSVACSNKQLYREKPKPKRKKKVNGSPDTD